MDIIIQSIKKLIEFTIIQYVNTGNKQTDAMLIPILISLMTIFFTFDYWKKGYDFIFGKTKNFYDMEEYNKHLAFVNNDQFKCINRIISPNDTNMTIFAHQLYIYIAKNCPYVPLNTQIYLEKNNYDIANSKLSFYKECDRAEIKKIQEKLQTKQKYPIYLKKSYFVCIIQSNYEIPVFCVNDEKTFIEFIDMIKKIPVEKSSDTKTSINAKEHEQIISMRNGKNNYWIFSDRTFDKYVSIHKPTILNLLKKFKNTVESKKSSLNGYGTHTFGLILHGKPGTGKTHLIRAICNYLKRDAFIINMREIKNCSELEQIFGEKWKTHVLVFDEFDCIQGVIKRTNNSNDHTNQSQIDFLHEKYMKLLEISSTSTNKDNNITEEIEKINKEIENTKSSITIDSFLTLLDGLAEYRGRAMIATTNYIDRIDEALIRPGRFDKLELNYFVNEEIRELLRNMYETPEDNLAWLNKIKFKERKYGPIDIINICQKYDSLNDVIEVLKE